MLFIKEKWNEENNLICLKQNVKEKKMENKKEKNIKIEKGERKPSLLRRTILSTAKLKPKKKEKN